MGKLKLTLFLAFKSIIRGNRWSLAMIIIVMSLSFANLILTPSIISGVTKTLNQQQIDTLYGNIILDPPPSDYYLSDVSRIDGRLLQYPGVTGTAPRLNDTALIEYNWADKASPTDKGDSGNWSVIDSGQLPGSWRY
jgi:putative ABC transport system permease protein